MILYGSHFSGLKKFLDFPSIFFALSIFQCFYRQQRSWGKVIFSEACVKNSFHIREQCMLGDTGSKLAVRILLGCILVNLFVFKLKTWFTWKIIHFCLNIIKSNNNICLKFPDFSGVLCDFPPTFPVCPKFPDFFLTGKCLPIFPDFPVQVGTLIH